MLLCNFQIPSHGDALLANLRLLLGSEYQICDVSWPTVIE